MGHPFKVGDKLDVRDTEYIWCQGMAELKITTASRPPLLYVHYEVKVSLLMVVKGMES